jgi:tRNA (guanine-N7-)-methyltransferase
MERWRVPNVRLLRTDASYFIRHVCPRDSLLALHIYHPDPWPKRRHHKRRLFQPQFVDAAVECLAPGGVLRVQTDHAEYFEWIRPMLIGHRLLEETCFGDAIAVSERDALAGEDGSPGDPAVPGSALGTNFETKYLREGRTVYRLAVRRVATGAG